MRLRRLIAPLGKRTELTLLARDAFWVSTWQVAIMVADIAQLSLVAHVLGLASYGRLALVIAFVTLVSQFFDFRVGTVATTFAPPRIASGDMRGAAGIFQMTYVVDLATGVVGLGAVVAAGSPLGGHVIGHGNERLLLLYAVTLLLSTVDDSTSALMRVFSRFRLLALYRVAIEAVRIGLVAAAVFVFHSLIAVVGALVLYDGIAAVANSAAACAVYRHESGRSLLRPALAAVSGDRRSMLAMVFHTNVVSYMRIAMSQLPTLLVGAFANATAVGVYKVGMAAALIPGKLTDPAYAALLPRLARLWSTRKFDEVRRLVKHATLIATPAMAATVVVVVLLRVPILQALAGAGHMRHAQAVLVIAIIGSAVDGILFWNISMLYAARRARAAAMNAVLTGAVQIALLVALVPPLEAKGAAIAFLVSTVLGQAHLCWLALRQLNVEEGRAAPATLEAREA